MLYVEVSSVVDSGVSVVWEETYGRRIDSG